MDPDGNGFGRGAYPPKETTMSRMSSIIIYLVCSSFLLGCGDDDAEGNDGQGGTGGQAAGADGDSGGTGGQAAGEGGAGGTGGETDAGRGGTADFAPEDPIDRSHLSDVGLTDPLDYSDPALWVCRPDHESNFCHHNIDATEILSDGSYQLVSHERAENPVFDCFYVYPTVLLSGEPNQTDFSDITIVADPLYSQASRFTSLCEMYAPLYRQAGLATGGVPIAGANGEVPLQDVKDAFAYYLEHFNQGRNFVLMGHSQGTLMLTRMMQDDLDNNPEVLSRMISALLIGGAVSVPEGELTGGTFQNIPLCSAPGDTGCVVHYVSYDADPPPAANAVFGGSPGEGLEIACTNPALLADNPGRFQGAYLRTAFGNPSFAPDDPIPEDITTPFMLYRDTFRGECVKRDGRSYLEISVDPDEGDQRPPPPYQTILIRIIGMGLHLVDYNLPMGDLLKMVRLQAEAMP